MNTAIDWLFSSPGFMPHGHCYLWQPGTLWLNVGSDALIASAYYAIPVGLFYLERKRRAEIPYRWIVMMFAAFIFLCGTTHLAEIWTVWRPEYRLEGALKFLTGLVSIATMLALFHLIPQAMLLRSPRQLQQEVALRTSELADVNRQLRDEIIARDQAQQQLKELDRRKDEFLATLAHELRNPLAPIRHAVSILGADTAAAEQQQLSREVIARQSQRMALMLDDLLDVSRITRGRLELKKEREDLAALVTAATDTVRPAIEQKQLTLSVSLPDERITLEVDPLRISQAISNLLTNAAKFTPAGGRITLSATTTPTHLVIIINDTGVGFDTSNTAELFEMFSQADAGVSGAEGLGIGLSLVKGLVELHGGSVAARSPGKGQGAEFAILLPLPMSARGETPAAPPPAPAPESPPLRIVIADDNRDAAATMGMLLELSGHVVSVAHSGTEALALCGSQRPDVAILDIGMPDLTGYEVARLLRSEPWGAHIFLLAITGWGQQSDVDKAHDAGFDQHLTKPADPDLIDSLIRQFVAARDAQTS
jgi:signal transduction histidine kinase/ActR/RegA family two-component response regulator